MKHLGSLLIIVIVILCLCYVLNTSVKENFFNPYNINNLDNALDRSNLLKLAFVRSQFSHFLVFLRVIKSFSS